MVNLQPDHLQPGHQQHFLILHEHSQIAAGIGRIRYLEIIGGSRHLHIWDVPYGGIHPETIGPGI